MNYLAHCALGGEREDHVIGGFLGDFIKGPLRDELNPGIKTGVQLHRRLDAFSAVQPDIRRSVTRLPAQLRRVAPVFIDLVADHFLARHFVRMHGESLAAFSERTYATLSAQREDFPEPARRFCDYLTQTDLFSRYVGLDVVGGAFTRIETRLRLSGAVDAAMAALDANYADFEADFARYYPALQDHARQWLLRADAET